MTKRALPRRRAFPLGLAALLSAAPAACDRGRSESAPAPEAPEASDLPRLTPDAGGLVLTWFDEEGEFHTAARVSEIPEDRRAVVRVQDPARPPPGPETVWLADLGRLEDGAYPIRQGTRSELERLAGGARAGPSAPAGVDASPAAPAERETSVVMYMTSTCPVCRRARSWLAANDVSFVERDVGRDEAAARDLRQKAARQGVRADGVPVFEVRGRLVAGFDQAELRRALGL